jgi:gas vesicle protein
MSRSSLTYVGVALAGGALGALVGLLAAPASGRETRKKLARSLEEGKNALARRRSRAVEGIADYVRAS